MSHPTHQRQPPRANPLEEPRAGSRRCTMLSRTIALAVAAVLLTAGCSRDDASDTDTTNSGVSTTTITAQTTTVPPEQASVVDKVTSTTGAPPEFSSPAEAAIAYGAGTAEAFLVGTRVDFALTDGGTLTTDSDGTRHVRNATGHSTFSGNDPRITGGETITWNSDWWGPSLSDSALTQWGTAVITTADGTWEGTFSGVYSTATTDVITWWLEGTAAYEGQSMFMWTTESNTRGEGINYALIFPGAPPVQTQLP